MEENKYVLRELNLKKSKCRCQSLLIETNSFVNTKAYPFLSLGTTQSKLLSTLMIENLWSFFDTLYWKRKNYNQHHQP